MGVRQPDGTILPACMGAQAEKAVKTTVQFVGGPLDGMTTFDYRPMASPSQTGFADGSNDFFRWMTYDLAMFSGGGAVGFQSSGIAPETYRKRYVDRDMEAKPQFCNYRLVQRDEKDGVVFAKFQFVEVERK